MNRPPMASPTRRWITPLACDRPMELEKVFRPTVPSKPAQTVARPSARTPRAMLRMSGRTQSVSAIRWQVVMSPVARRAQARAPIMNGRAKEASKLGSSRGNWGMSSSP
nr:hypothetical protein [Fodinicurvata fenggangensis]